MPHCVRAVLKFMAVHFYPSTQCTAFPISSHLMSLSALLCSSSAHVYTQRPLYEVHLTADLMMFIWYQGAQKCVKKLSPTSLHHQQLPSIEGMMDLCFHVVYSKVWAEHLSGAASDKAAPMFFHSYIVLFWRDRKNWSLFVAVTNAPLGWSSAVVAIRASIRDSLAVSFLACWTSLSSYLSHLQGIFIPTAAPHWIFFPFSDHSL